MSDKIISSPLNWYGGKCGNNQRELLKTIINYINNYNEIIFVDVFGGSGVVAINVKKELRVYNDIYSNLFNFFNVLRDDALCEDLVSRLTLTLYGKETYKDAQNNLSKVTGSVDKAYYFYIATMQSIDSAGSMNHKSGWSYSKKDSRRGMAQAVSRWLRNVDENLPDSVEQIRELQVTNEDAFDCINRWNRSNAIFYLDPPYMKESRVSKEVYNNEFTVEEHKKLIDTLIKVNGNAIISGYDSEIYDKLAQNGWSKKEFKVCTSTSPCENNPIRKEVIWAKESIIDNKI